jgi:hypothetical protein
MLRSALKKRKPGSKKRTFYFLSARIRTIVSEAKGSEHWHANN